MNRISGKIERLSGVCEFSEFNLRVRWLVKEKNGTKLVGSCFVTESILEACLSTKCCSDSELAFFQFFCPGLFEVTSEEDVSSQQTNFSSRADAACPAPAEA